MQYFPTEGHFDKMYFPYYGKKAHVSVTMQLNRLMPESDLVTGNGSISNICKSAVYGAIKQSLASSDYRLKVTLK